MASKSAAAETVAWFATGAPQYYEPMLWPCGTPHEWLALTVAAGHLQELYGGGRERAARPTPGHGNDCPPRHREVA